MKDVSIKDVAARAGVSAGTVSNVLNRPGKVAEETRLRVERAVQELGFVRHGSASSLRAGRSRSLGLAVIDIANPFFTEVAAGAEDVASAEGYAVLLANSAADPAKQERVLRVLAEQRVGGVLITPVGDELHQLDLLRERGINVVLVDHPAHRPDQCAVAVNDVAGGTLAATHLLASGARALTYVSGPLGIRQCRDRLDGARRAGAPVTELIVPAMNARGGERAAADLLAAGPLPEAVFCANDLLALGLLRGLLQAGVRVPEQVRVVGYDDIDLAGASVVALTSVRQPIRRLGQVAAELLLDECDHPETHAHRQIMFQPELVVRESAP
ncbi:LacI family DNA-binding transcriptional regulator [Nonomuraea sp. NPDC050310]|uniref:LacI family DNA-binding transcriptional regulator n=1 Tax=unclassified Nonomuraea TaxID=2593643 RepID=UPI0033FC02A0